ncbi:Uncharacterised protein [Klebsiella pneumoniae]|nr:Uncharacterised protein [Klebsiella pneumoniae]
MGVGIGTAAFHLLPHAGVPGGTGKPEMGLVPAWLTQNGEPPTKARRAVVEVVGVEVVDPDAVAARADKRVGIGVFCRKWP